MKFRPVIATILLSVPLSFGACTGFGPQGLIYTSTSIAVYGTEVQASKEGRACYP